VERLETLAGVDARIDRSFLLVRDIPASHSARRALSSSAISTM